MNIRAAARRWRDTWLRSWPTHDSDAVASLYADGAMYRSHPFREPEPGGALGYVTQAFADERTGAVCWFGEPVVDGDRAAVEYWAMFDDAGGSAHTLAGTSVLRFQDDGQVVDHMDYWVMGEGAISPPPGRHG